MTALKVSHPIFLKTLTKSFYFWLFPCPANKKCWPQHITPYHKLNLFWLCLVSIPSFKWNNHKKCYITQGRGFNDCVTNCHMGEAKTGQKIVIYFLIASKKIINLGSYMLLKRNIAFIYFLSPCRTLHNTCYFMAVNYDSFVYKSKKIWQFYCHFQHWSIQLRKWKWLFFFTSC
jgi:hypothetical protein